MIDDNIKDRCDWCGKEIMRCECYEDAMGNHYLEEEREMREYMGR